jgi:CheY-like chemotaxis protein
MSEVLVVDPGELGELLAALFGQYGVEAVFARTGEEALELALEDTPQVFVIEHDLPDVSGLDLADLVREELDAKVILTYSLHNVPEDEREPFFKRLTSANASFARPFRSRTVIGCASRLLGFEVDPDVSGEHSIVGPVVDQEEVLLLDEEVPEEVPAAAEADVTREVELVPQEGARPGQQFVYGSSSEPEPGFEDVAVTTAPEPPALPSEDAPPQRASVPVEELNKPRPFKDPEGLSHLWEKVREEPRTSREGMSLESGQLSERRLVELLDAFHSSQTTGEIWLEQGEDKRVLLLVRGVIVGARTSVSAEKLATLAVRAGILTVDQARECYAEVAANKQTSFRRVALKRGLLDEETVVRLLGEQVRRIVLRAFKNAGGSYRITLDGHGKREPLRVEMTAADAIVRGMTLAESLVELREAAPDDARFGPDPDSPYGLEQLTLSAEEARYVIAMDGTKTLEDLAVLNPELNERTRRGLAAGMVRIGLVRFVGRGRAAPRAISFF